MSDTETRDRVCRVMATDAQWKELRRIAFENEQELRTLITAALQTSPLTKRAFA